TQWLLSKPLSKAMTAHYDVSGDLDAPQLSEAPAPPAKPQDQAPHAGRIQGQGLKLDGEAGSGLRQANELNGRTGAVSNGTRTGARTGERPSSASAQALPK